MLEIPESQTVSRHDVIANRMGKVFVQPSRMEDMYIHNGNAKDGFYVVGEQKNRIPNGQIQNDIPTTDLICVDHYYTKSYEEWLEKLKRGSCDSNFFRKYEHFFMYNPDMEYCREDLDISQLYEESTKEGSSTRL